MCKEKEGPCQECEGEETVRGFFLDMMRETSETKRGMKLRKGKPQEPRTKNQQPTTNNQEPRTKNQESRIKNQERGERRPR